MAKFGMTLSNRGVVTGATTVPEMLDLAGMADADSRWDSVWVGDSLLAKPRLDALTLLGSVAARTERVRLGPACFASTPLRPPVLLAYQWASLDLISGGRTIFVACMGARPSQGAGNSAQEFETFCVAPETRMGRMEEAIEAMRLLTRGERASYEGEYVSFKDVLIEPQPVQQPIPIWVTSNPAPHLKRNREAGLRRVARLGDGWMTTFQSPEIVAEYLADIRGYAEEMGRELPADFEVGVYYNINVNEDRERALREAKEYLDAYYMTDYTREQLELWVAMGSPEACIADIQRYIEAGATTVMLRFVSSDQQGQYRRVSEEVLPAFA